MSDRVLKLGADRFDDIVSALCDAFHDYPVMRYVLKGAGDAYDDRLLELIGYFTASRTTRGWPVLGIEEDGRLVAAANVNPPTGASAPPALKERYEAMCASLGSDAIGRFHKFADLCDGLEPEGPYYSLGMIGVCGGYQGRGLARELMDALHAMSARDPESLGVVLTTELEANLGLYRHLGYRVIGEGDADELHSWTLVRADDASAT